MNVRQPCCGNFLEKKKLFDTKKVLLFNYFPSHLTTTNSLDYIQKKLTLDELHVISEDTTTISTSHEAKSLPQLLNGINFSLSQNPIK